MAPYALLFVLPVLWLMFPSGHLAPVTIWIVLTLFVGARREVGGDWNHYLLLFNRGRTYRLPVAIALSDPGYMLLGRVIAKLKLDVGVLNLVCASIFSTGAVMYAGSQPSPPLVLLIAIPVGVIVLAMGFTRQSISVGWTLIALSLWESGQHGAAAVCLLVSVLFHSSALLLLPLPLLLASPGTIDARTAIAAGLVVGTAFWLARRLCTRVDKALSRQAKSAGAKFRLLPTYFCLVVVWGLRSDFSLVSTEAPLLSYFAFISAVVAVTGLHASGAADRLGFYTIIFQMMVLPDLVATGVWRYPRELSLAGLFLAYFSLFAGWAMWSGFGHSWTPYRTYLTAPQDLYAPMPTPLSTQIPREERWRPFHRWDV